MIMLQNSKVNNCTYLHFKKERRGSQDDDVDDGDDGIDTGELREQDRFLPIANVARIMKKAIPSQVHILKVAVNLFFLTKL